MADETTSMDAAEGLPEKKQNRFRNSRIWRRFYLRQLPRRKRMHGTIAHRLLGNRLLDHHLWIFDRESTARGMAVGAFAGLLPIPGLQILLAIVLCFLWRVNIIAAAAATFLSNPFTAFPILYAQAVIGHFLLYPGQPFPAVKDVGVLNLFVSYGRDIVVGSIPTSLFCALTAYLLTRWFWTGVTKLKHPREAPPPAAGRGTVP